MKLDKVYTALRDAVKLAKLSPDAFEMESLVESADTTLTGKGGFAYFLALVLGADNELMIVRSIEDGQLKEKKLIHPYEYCMKKFPKTKEANIEVLFSRFNWPKEMRERYYESPEFSLERVQVLEDVVEHWISLPDKRKF